MALFKSVNSVATKKNKSKLQGCVGCTFANPMARSHYGQGKKGIMILTDIPFRHEDRIDAKYKRLKNDLALQGIDLEQDCYLVSAYHCMKLKQEESKKSMDTLQYKCSNKLLNKVKKIQPKVILSLGSNANKMLILSRLGGRLSGSTGDDFRGYEIPDQELNTWIVPTYSYSEIERTKFYDEYDVVVLRQFKEALKRANELTTVSIPKVEMPEIEYLETIPEACDWLSLQHDLWEGEEVSFDIETTGIKSQADGHKIECIAFTSNGVCGVMPYFAYDEDFRAEMKRIMVNPKIKKIAQNAQYEDVWMHNRSGEKRKYRVQGWHWDTMLAEHCINSKKKTGLKFQTYVHLGVLNYDSKADKYLKAENEKSKNAINNIHKAPKKALHKYCALDTIYTHEAYKRQLKFFTKYPKLRVGSDFLLEGTLCLASMHINGQSFDREKAIHEKVKIETEIRNRIKALKESEWGKGWDGATGGENIYNHVYKTLKLKNIDKKQTAGGKDALDIDVMEKMEHPFTDEILKIKKLEKAIGTYIDGYLAEEAKGFIHPFFGLGNTDTFRSNSYAPNAQNIPKRDKNTKRIIRECIRPRKGNRLMAWDYKALETIIASCNYPDTNWIEYVTDLKSDMHWDWSVKMLEFDEDFIEEMILQEIKGDVRGWVKNQAVFPSIYGSASNSISSGLFKVFKRIPLMWEWMEEKGWDNYENFRLHIKERYEWYWNEWFPEYKELREKDWEKYKRNGYTNNLTGFRYQGALGYTEFCNYKTQGSASHVKLWTAIEVEKEIKKRGLKSKLVWEIHDEIGADVPEDECDEMNELVKDIGTRKVREAWDWIIVPLVMDCEASEVDGTWNVMNSYPSKVN